MTPPACEAARVLLCDDIREEADGRQSLIGVHGPSLRVSRFPHTRRGLSAFVQLVNPAETYHSVEYELLGPDGLVLGRGGGPTEPVASTKEFTQFSTYRIHFYPLQLAAPGAYAVRVWLDRPRGVGLEASLAVTLIEPGPEAA